MVEEVFPSPRVHELKAWFLLGVGTFGRWDLMEVLRSLGHTLEGGASHSFTLPSAPELRIYSVSVLAPSRLCCLTGELKQWIFNLENSKSMSCGKSFLSF